MQKIHLESIIEKYNFEKNQIVYFCNKNKLNWSKLDTIYEGPAIIEEQKLKQIYLIKFFNFINKKDKFITVHKNNLRVKLDDIKEFQPKIGQEVYYKTVKKIQKIIKKKF